MHCNGDTDLGQCGTMLSPPGGWPRDLIGPLAQPPALSLVRGVSSAPRCRADDCARSTRSYLTLSYYSLLLISCQPAGKGSECILRVGDIWGWWETRPVPGPGRAPVQAPRGGAPGLSRSGARWAPASRPSRSGSRRLTSTPSPSPTSLTLWAQSRWE